MLLEISENEYQKVATNLIKEIETHHVIEEINESVNKRHFVFMDADEKPRACAILYFPELKYKEENCCFFGNFICVEEESIFTDFFIELEKIATVANAQQFIGPINGSTWNNYRWSITEGKAFFPGDVINPVFYPNFLQNIGYEIISRYQTSYDAELSCDAETVARKSAHLSSLNWTIRTLNNNDLDEELSRIYDLSAIAFADNFLFTPISETDFIVKYKTWLQLISTDMILLAEDAKGDLLAFLFAYPDGKKGVVIKTLARLPGDEYRGIGLMLCQYLYDFLSLEKYDYTLHALMQQSNYSIKTSKTLSGSLRREYALFGKKL